MDLRIPRKNPVRALQHSEKKRKKELNYMNNKMVRFYKNLQKVSRVLQRAASDK